MAGPWTPGSPVREPAQYPFASVTEILCAARVAAHVGPVAKNPLHTSGILLDQVLPPAPGPWTAARSRVSRTGPSHGIGRPRGM